MATAAGRRVYLLYRVGDAVLRALPSPLALALGALGGWVASFASAERREIVGDNLRHVVGSGLQRRELRRLVRRSYAAYGRYWADGARLGAPGTRGFDRRWQLEHGEVYFDALAEDKGVILVLPHLGAWEAGGAWSASIGHPLTTVAEPLEPPELFQWFVERRRQLGINVLPSRTSALAELSAVLRAGGVVALLADRDVTGDGIEVDLCGAKTRLPAGPALLALRTGAALLPCAVYLEPHGRHRAVIRPPIAAERSGRLRADAQRVTQLLADELGALIAARPEQWHVFRPNWPSDQRG